MKVKKHPYRSSELSWLAFNARVLQEAADAENPLYERLKFLAIFSSNLDEFFKVKVSRLRQIKNVSKRLRKKLIVKPNKKLKAINKEVLRQQELFGSIFKEKLIPGLREKGIHLIAKEDFTPFQQDIAFSLFQEQLQMAVEIIWVHKGQRPFLKDGQLYLAIASSTALIAFITIPVFVTGRFVQFPKAGNTYPLTFIEEVIKDNLQELFPDKTALKAFEVKLSRDAELYLDDEYSGELASQIYENLSQRKKGQATRLLFDKSMPGFLRKNIKEALELGKVDMIPGGKYHNFNDFFDFPDPVKDAALHYRPFTPLPHPVLKAGCNYFEIIEQSDQVVHFPYQSFDVLQDFISAAAQDNEVTAIKISLYRVARKSRLTEALLSAAEKGKEVVVFIEAQARFDEANNYEWGKRFEAQGIKVFYSMKGLKVHSKILQVYRMQDKRIQKYAFIGTGNFNAKTAKVYCDHGLFTANQAINSDLSLVFNVLEGKRSHIVPNHLLVSPFTTRFGFENLIDQEIRNARAGKKAGITAKMNALTDKKMIVKLYEASQAGVKIRLLVRGMCSLVPGVPGLSENIFITSIVDRFLEHGRIYKFENKGTPLLFIGSADWMPRNLDSRIEVLVPIRNKNVFQELSDLLEIQLQDTVKARIFDQEETNAYVEQSDNSAPVLSSQMEQIKYLSALNE